MEIIAYNFSALGLFFPNKPIFLRDPYNNENTNKKGATNVNIPYSENKV